jgi:hypothetical protein
MRLRFPGHVSPTQSKHDTPSLQPASIRISYRQQGKTMYLVVITGYGQLEPRVLDAGFDAHLKEARIPGTAGRGHREHARSILAPDETAVRRTVHCRHPNAFELMNVRTFRILSAIFF